MYLYRDAMLSLAVSDPPTAMHHGGAGYVTGRYHRYRRQLLGHTGAPSLYRASDAPSSARTVQH